MNTYRTVRVALDEYDYRLAFEAASEDLLQYSRAHSRGLVCALEDAGVVEDVTSDAAQKVADDFDQRTRHEVESSHRRALLEDAARSFLLRTNGSHVLTIGLDR